MSNTNTNTNTWDINSLKKERENIKRNIIKLNNAKQRKRLIALHNKSLASKKKGLRPRIMSNREKENHKTIVWQALNSDDPAGAIEILNEQIQQLATSTFDGNVHEAADALFEGISKGLQQGYVNPDRLNAALLSSKDKFSLFFIFSIKCFINFLNQ